MKPNTSILRILSAALLISSATVLKAGWDRNNPFQQKVFIENKGQFDGLDERTNSNIRYVIEEGGRMFFKPNGVTYQMAILEDKEDMEGKKMEDRMKVDYSFIHMDWIGANPMVQMVAETKVPEYFTYPSKQSRNATIIADAFKKITYKNLYPNIDVVYEFHATEGIKYTLILHPGANPALVKMKYTSTKKIFVDDQGNVHLKSIKGDIIDHAPVTFYEADKTPIKSSFDLSNNTVTFKLENYDNTKTVVIDPWTTNPAFTGLNRAYNICKDAAGNLYSTGGVNPFYLKKFTPAGVLIWTFTLPNGQNWSIDNVVEPATGESYICYGAWSGNIDSKVSTAGTIVFNNTAAQNGSNNTFGEAYELALNCKTGLLYGAGFFSGPNTSVWQMNKTNGMQSGWVNANPGTQVIEVRSMETDAVNGDVYLMSVPLGSNQAGNRLIRMTQALAPVWNVNDGYNLTEAQAGFYQGYCCNGINSLAVGCFVYTHDGLTIKKWDKNNGALLGNTNIPGGQVHMCSGLWLDVCGNLYAGSMTGIYKYDQNLVQLGFGGTGGAVYDIIAGNIPGEVIAAGNGFIQSVNMNTCSNLSITTTFTPPTCGLCDAKATATSNACAVSYSWNTGATTNSITNLCGGTYTVYLVSGCSASNVFTTVTIPLSGNAFTVNSTVINADCFSATGTVNINSITGSTGNFTLAEGTNTITNTMSPPYSITGVSVGTHTYTVYNSMGCSVTFTAQIINVGIPPNLTATTPVSLGCVPSTVTLNAASTSTGSLTWTWTGTGIVSGAATNSPVVNQTGTYTVLLALGTCTTSSVVTVNPNTTPPNISIAPPASLTCAQGSITLNGSSTTSGAIFQWTSGPSTSSNVVSSAGNYTLTVTDPANGCKSTATTNVVFVNTLAALATGTNVKCFGGNTGSASVTVTGGSNNYTYFWSNSSLSSNPTGLTAGVYTVTAVDGFCTITTTVLISQPPALSLAITSNTTNACANTVINVNAFASGGVGPYTYTWNPGPNTSAYNVQEINAGNYTYQLSVTDANGCPVANSINLTFNPIPVITVSSGTVCFGDKAVLNASGAEQYKWMPINYSGATYTTTGSSNMYNTVVGTNTSTGCSSLPVTSTLIVNPLPVPAISAGNNKGCVPVCVTFTASNSGGAIQNCSWDFGDGSFASNVINTDRCFTMAGEYTVTATITDANGCVAKTTYTVEAYPYPTADFNWSPIKPIVNRDEVTFTDASFNANIVKWDWYFMDLPKPHSNDRNPIYQYMEAGTYPVALVVSSDHGCTDTIVQVIIVGEDYGIYVPNIFSPNGDGLNDVFQPKGFGIVDYTLRIFNRWGEELMMTNDFGHGWDGMFKGKLSQEDTYIWKINLTNVFGKSHELTGHVTLIK